jgi:DNA-binding NarL/FixJ family response regulator
LQCAQGYDNTEVAEKLNTSANTVEGLANTIFDYIREHNLRPKKYIWKANGEKILEKIHRAREVYAGI